MASSKLWGQLERDLPEINQLVTDHGKGVGGNELDFTPGAILSMDRYA
jgi:hypothetical protein